MLSLKNNENDAPYSIKFATKKKAKIKIKFQKNKGCFFEQHPVVKKTPTDTDL